MRIIVHDLCSPEWQAANIPVAEQDVIVSDDGTLKNCIGCFGCWVKTPGTCVIHDGYQHMGAYLGTADTLLLISRNCCGSQSPFVKSVLDRSIGYIHPNFRTINGEMHHRKRFSNTLKLHAIFYGDQTDFEKNTAEALVQAQAVNLAAKSVKVDFIDTLQQLSGVIA
jgi:multimeric flavodoxin WrbA